MPVSEVCDESLNNRANQDGRQRQCSENMAGTAFREAAKTKQSRYNEINRQKVLTNTLRSVTLYSERGLLYSVSIFDLAKSRAKWRNRQCQV